MDIHGNSTNHRGISAICPGLHSSGRPWPLGLFLVGRLLIEVTFGGVFFGETHKDL